MVSGKLQCLIITKYENTKRVFPMLLYNPGADPEPVKRWCKKTANATHENLIIHDGCG